MKLFACLLTIFLAISSFGQNFEGKMLLKISFQSKIPAVSNEQLTAMLGSEQEYYIKGAEYKSVTNGSMVEWQVYNSTDNKLYYKFGNTDTLLWIDGATNKDAVLNAEINKAVTKILGYTCDELILTCQNSVQKFYYHTGILGVDATLYEKHLFGNWYRFISTTHALALKSIIEDANFVQVIEAKEIIPMKLQKSMFALPAGAVSVEMPM